MEVKASLKHLRISPRKTRLVAGLIRGLEVKKAADQLKFSSKKASKPMLKLLNSAIANAINNYDLDKDNLIIKEIKVDDGKTLKRWMPRAHGRATTIRKRMSHVCLTLAEIVDSGKKEPKKVKVSAPVKLDELSGKKDAEKKGAKKNEEVKNEKASEVKTHDKEKDANVSGKASSKSFAGNIFRRKSG